MTPIAAAFLRGMSWTCWLVADAIDPPAPVTLDAEFAELDAAQTDGGPWS